jgi:hypothetical protein
VVAFAKAMTWIKYSIDPKSPVRAIVPTSIRSRKAQFVLSLQMSPLQQFFVSPSCESSASLYQSYPTPKHDNLHQSTSALNGSPLYQYQADPQCSQAKEQ